MAVTSATDFLDVLACPECGADLDGRPDGAGLACTGCRTRFAATDGVVDFVGVGTEPATTTQRAMQFRPLVRVYERFWRPALTRLLTGVSHDAERAWSLEHLAPAPDATVLDLACGPGNTTRTVATAVPAGRVLGVDYSPPMLRAAVGAPWSGPATVGYVRGDAHRLPLRPDSLDAANCAGAFYLFADPAAVLAGLAAALRQGATFTLMASRRPPVAGGFAGRVAGASGLRVYAPGEMEGLLDAAGFDVVDRRGAGFMVLLATQRR